MPKSKPKKQSRASGSRRAPAPRRGQSNEGEGNRTAARNYNRGVAETIQSGKVPEKARAAVRALEGPEGDELRGAEAQAKRGKTASGHSAHSK